MDNGVLDVLNAGTGHLEFKFNKADPAEVEHAKKVITDMLKRRYTILVEVDGKLEKVTHFDPETEMYYIDPPERRRPGRPKGWKKQGLPMRRTKATGLAPSAGG